MVYGHRRGMGDQHFGFYRDLEWFHRYSLFEWGPPLVTKFISDIVKGPKWIGRLRSLSGWLYFLPSNVKFHQEEDVILVTACPTLASLKGNLGTESLKIMYILPSRLKPERLRYCSLSISLNRKTLKFPSLFTKEVYEVT